MSEAGSGEHERRRFPRAELPISVTFRYQGDEKVAPAVNTGAGGMFIASRATLIPNTGVEVRFSLPGGSKAYEFKARVIHLVDRDKKTGTRAGFGVAFKSTDVALLRELDDAVRNYLSLEHGRPPESFAPARSVATTGPTLTPDEVAALAAGELDRERIGVATAPTAPSPEEARRRREDVPEVAYWSPSGGGKGQKPRAKIKARRRSGGDGEGPGEAAARSASRKPPEAPSAAERAKQIAMSRARGLRGESSSGSSRSNGRGGGESGRPLPREPRRGANTPDPDLPLFSVDLGSKEEFLELYESSLFARGLLVESDDFQPAGSDVLVELTLPGRRKPLVFLGQVVQAVTGGPGGDGATGFMVELHDTPKARFSEVKKAAERARDHVTTHFGQDSARINREKWERLKRDKAEAERAAAGARKVPAPEPPPAAPPPPPAAESSKPKKPKTEIRVRRVPPPPPPSPTRRPAPAAAPVGSQGASLAMESALDTWLEELEYPQPVVRQSAIMSIGRMGPVAGRAVPDLLASLKDENQLVRCSACWALAGVGASTETGIQGLVDALSDEHVAVREAAARALGEFGPAALDALPALDRLMRAEDEIEAVRHAAYDAIEQIQE